MPTRRLALAITVGALLLAAGGVASADPGGRSAATAGPSASAKLDSGLKMLASAAAEGKPVNAATGIGAAGGIRLVSGARIDHGDVLVNVHVDGAVDAAAAALRDLGMDVVATSDQAPERVVVGWLPAGSLVDAAALPSAKAVTTSHGMTDRVDGGTDAGSVLSEGDAAQHGPQARATGLSGAGVKVGVISDSINVGTNGSNGIATSQGTGDLPAHVTSLLDDTSGTDEGRAMAEIIYDEAPGVTDMVFSSGTATNAAGKATSINNLVAAGVKVIADDIFYPDEPMFQDGVVAQAVDAAKAAGVVYLASAGNRARQSWEGTLTGATEDFDPGAGVDNVQTLGTFGNRRAFLVLQWAQPWGDATTDLALDVYDGSTFIGTADTDNVTTGLPMEFAQINIAPGNHNLGIGIRRVAGTGTPFMKYLVGGLPTFSVAEFPTSSNAINPDAASANGSLAVAASNWASPTTPEPFSSRGPSITRFFDKDGVLLGSPELRSKPQLAAADGVTTSVPGFQPFFGTSAATPSAAGIATLIRAAQPALSVDQVRAIMTDPANTRACATAAPAADCGAGFLMADLAIRAVDSTPPTVTSTVSPAGPTGRNGWYTGQVSVTWQLTDAQSVIVAQTGCNPTTPPNGTTTLSCRAASAGGTASGSVTIKRDTTGPTKLNASGLKRVYPHGTKPHKKKIKCRATDAESGLAGCNIKGLKASPGKHTVTVIATNNAGLVTKKKFRYTIL
jgi:hypothetical protein